MCCELGTFWKSGRHGGECGQSDSQPCRTRTGPWLPPPPTAESLAGASAPTSRLTKFGPDDNVEAYLEVFERTAQWESWPVDQWAHILSLFLTGPAQQARQDLTPEHASQYPELKQAILAYHGHSLAARGQHFHNWWFDILTQITQQGMLVRRWLMAGEGPSTLDRVLIDNTVRQLLPDAWRALTHHHPGMVDELVR